ncbi:MAG: hypothetical protein MZV70_42290 [Desulfobacterales bacterium]|nr:hypothetical protein [Desulfobacterales bacterium]
MPHTAIRERGRHGTDGAQGTRLQRQAETGIDHRGPQAVHHLAEGAEEVPSVTAGLPKFGPISLNLDLTTACNFSCPHCVDSRLLNTGDYLDLETDKTEH